MPIHRDTCEMDQEPCASLPCPNGVQCIPFYNDYLCKCPNGYTGKHCESRGFEDHDTSSCSKTFVAPQDIWKVVTSSVTVFVEYFNRHRALTNLNLDDYSGISSESGNSSCSVGSPNPSSHLLCKKKRDPKYRAHCNVPYMRNIRVLVPVEAPPPLPPRGFRNLSSKTIGVSSTAITSTQPMVKVKPYSSDIRQSRCSSQCGSSKGTRRDSLPSDKFRRANETSNRIRQSDRRDPRGGDLLTSLRTSPVEWMGIDDRIDCALKYSRAAAGAMVVGDTELMPVMKDDDYIQWSNERMKHSKETMRIINDLQFQPMQHPLNQSSKCHHRVEKKTFLGIHSMTDLIELTNF